MCSRRTAGLHMMPEAYREQSWQLLLQQSLDFFFAQGVWFAVGARVRIEGAHQDGHGCLQLGHGCWFW